VGASPAARTVAPFLVFFATCFSLEMRTRSPVASYLYLFALAVHRYLA
jgi:hypothetical protein